MPGGMELDHVPAPAEAVEAVQHRRIAVGLEAPLDRLGAPQNATEIAETLARPAAALARHGLVERPIALEQVVIYQRRGLILDVVRGGAMASRRRVNHGKWPPCHILHTDEGYREIRSPRGRRAL